MSSSSSDLNKYKEYTFKYQGYRPPSKDEPRAHCSGAAYDSRAHDPAAHYSRAHDPAAHYSRAHEPGAHH